MPVYNQQPRTVIRTTDIGSTFTMEDRAPVMNLRVVVEADDGSEEETTVPGAFGPAFGSAFSGGGQP